MTDRGKNTAIVILCMLIQHGEYIAPAGLTSAAMDEALEVLRFFHIGREGRSFVFLNEATKRAFL